MQCVHCVRAHQVHPPPVLYPNAVSIISFKELFFFFFDKLFHSKN